MNKVADKLQTVLREDEDLEPEFADDLSRFIRGSLINATELVQTKRDLGRTKMAERVQNSPLQSGGVITKAEARHMVQQNEVDEVTKARKVVGAAELKVLNTRKPWFFEPAKKARKMRLDRRLKPAEVVDTEGGNWLLKPF